MKPVRVWTKQHRGALDILRRTGRYTARREYIQSDLQECAPLVLTPYDWLVTHSPAAARRPADAEYPVWVSFRADAAMLPDDGSAVLELELDSSEITRINIAKWGAILNYAYLPADPADKARHAALLRRCGVSDAKAMMTPFYPELQQEILSSWERLFDDRVQLGNTYSYGTIWEIRQEWIVSIKP